MRTTINLPDDLLAQVKKVAAASHSTVTALIGDALREALSKRRHKRQNGRVTLTTYGKKDLHPSVDLNDGAALLDLMEPPRRPLFCLSGLFGLSCLFG
ncbi:MAG TPA: ribbon-helix-helix protein, CopG family [Nitrospiraceae bacterium]|nr:ribbon-helix-helix protein, CopG family [Nitrospiraceae bacterium]